MQNEQERRTILAIGLSLLVYMVWVQWFMPPMTPAPTVTDVASITESAPDATVADVPSEDAPTKAVEGDDQASAETTENTPEPVEPEEVIEDHSVVLDNNGLQGEFTSREGAIRSTALIHYNSQPDMVPIWTWLMDKWDSKGGDWVPYTGGTDPEPLLSEQGSFVLSGMGAIATDGKYRLTEEGEYLVAKGTVRNGIRVTKNYRKTEDPHVFDVTVQFENVGTVAARDLWVGVADTMDGDAGRFTNTVRPIAHVDDSIERLDDLEEADGTEAVRYRGVTDWFGIGNKYFMSVLAPKDDGASELVFDDLGDGRYGAFYVSTTALDAGATRELNFLAYLGPKDLDMVGLLGHNLDKSIEFGWFGIFAKPLLWLLKAFHGFAGNWGVAIIMLTILIKIIFFPLMQKQFVSSKRMQALQPQLKELKEKYKDNRELQTQATMRLFQENKVNPMSGCLPMIIQMPVWFALYNVMLYSVELYGTKFLYLQDLTEVDPYGVLPLLVSVLMVLQQKMMPMGNMDPAQQKIMRLMPVMFGIFMFTFPAGLVLYFSVNNSLTILQQWIIYRKKDEEVQVPASE